MLEYKCKVYVNARFDGVWQKLLDKIFHPEKYVEGIRNVEILENDDNHILRLIRFENDQWQELKELIVHDKSNGMIVYRLVDHPRFQGETINTCRTTNQVSQSELEYEIHRKLKDESQSESDDEKHKTEQTLQLAIHQMKKICEVDSN